MPDSFPPRSMRERMISKPTVAWAGVGVVAAVVLLWIGCRENKPATATSSSNQQRNFRDADKGESLLKAATSQLADLPAAVDTDLHPPTVILDSRKSADGKDVLASCKAAPHSMEESYNLIEVSTGNGRFRSLGVQAGDILKYYVVDDKTVDEDSRNAGYTRKLAMDLNVAQVLDDNTLLLEAGLNQAVQPAKIEIWRNSDERQSEIHDQLRLYEVYRKPPIGWEPTPDFQVMTQVMAWLNQWIRQVEPKANWHPDPQLETLPTELRSDKEFASRIAAEALAARSFLPEDSRDIQEAIWARDVARWAHGEGFDHVSRATALFDWTIRNIQLEAAGDLPPRRPWQTLLYGRGSAKERALVFALLCRQQGIDVVIVSLLPKGGAGDGKGPPKTDGEFWLPAVFANGQLYLYDVTLGLPVPDAKGSGVATLEEVRANDALLRQLDLDGDKYPVTAEMLKNVEIDLVASPFALSRRASQMEANLAGDDRLSLTARPSELAGKLKGVAGVGVVRLWDFPFQTVRDQLVLGKTARHNEALAFEPFAMRPGLWKGRTRHFQGQHSEALGDTTEHKQQTKSSDGYLSRSVRPTDREIAESNTENKRRVDIASKLDAGYWVGLMSFDDHKYEVAATWLKRPELTAAGSPWAAGANYNLARTWEALGKLDAAIALLENDTSPQQHGNKLRARMLKSRQKSAKATGKAGE